MINLFRALEKRNRENGRPAEENVADVEMLGKTISEYMMSRLAAVCNDLRDNDIEALSYLEMLFFRVIEDRRILPSERSLLKVLDKLEEDLGYSVEQYGERAEFILDFLEADTLRKATDKSANRREKEVLGRLKRIRYMYLAPKKEKKKAEWKRPMEIKAYLDDYIIGQEDAKIAVSAAVYGHGKRVRHPELRFAPNVVLLIGPSGCGKTEIMRRIREITEYPMVFTDVSSLGASQFRGRHKEDILLELYEAADRKKAVAEKGIVFMDEFDKLLLPAISERGVNIHDDVQSQMLTMLEGSEIELKVDGQPLLLDTTNMLFVLAGAFQGIEEYIRADQKKKKNMPGNIGFLSPLEKEMDLEFVRDNINHEVLMNYGMKRELAGRISTVSVLERLTEEDLMRILTEPKDSLIERYERELRLSGEKELIFTDGALRAVAQEALKTPVGARALQGILGRVLRPVLYRAPDLTGLKRIVIHEDVILHGEEPLYEVDPDAVDGGRKPDKLPEAES
ncbi:MAG: AAA family ATPase [Lachnospiraceae bacterium]|nr:AAA family ATPase [Lachnospiraceae bacterium]